jgi:cytochrome b561
MKQSTSYSVIQRAMHWLMALSIFGLFGLGFWMVDLTYYSEWYRTAPYWHQSIGVLLAVCWLVRLVIIRIQGKPKPLISHSKFEIKAAHAVHTVLYLLMFCLFISGYLISTADGRAIAVFNWFEIPGLGELFAEQSARAGLVHEYSAYALIAFAALHALGALKHHFIDKDDTLNRMLGRTLPQQPSNTQEH